MRKFALRLLELAQDFRSFGPARRKFEAGCLQPLLAVVCLRFKLCNKGAQLLHFLRKPLDSRLGTLSFLLLGLKQLLNLILSGLGYVVFGVL